MSAISASFISSFGLSGSLGVGTASILGGNATNSNPNAASITAASTTATGALSVLSNATTATDQSPTIQALTTGKLTNQQHKVLAALGSSSTPTALPWDTNGVEPDVLATIRKYGWIKEVAPTYDTKTREITGATYELTPIGQAINRRTGGTDAVGVTPAQAAAAANGLNITA